MNGLGVIRQVEMTPASREPVSWHAVTRDLNRYRVVSAIGIFRQLGCCAAGSVVDRLISQLMNLPIQRQIAVGMQLGHEYDDHLLLRIDPKCGVEEPGPVV